MWKLFIDDERDPITNDWVIARTSIEAIHACVKFGLPHEIAFDHDLGGDDTSIHFINWLTDIIIDSRLIFPMGFSYSVHSQNPIGKKNIEGRMDNLINYASRHGD
jgi:hypothetical protein